MIDIHSHAIGASDIKLPERCKENKKYSFLNSPIYQAYTKIADYLPKEFSRTFFSLGLLAPLRSQLFMKITKPFHDLFLTEVGRLINQTTIDELIESMDNNCIEKSVILAIEPYIKTKELLEVTKGNDRLYVFGSVNMDSRFYLENAEDLLYENIYGFKFHPAMQFIESGDYRIYEIMEIVAKKSLPTLFDTGFFPSKENKSTDIMDMEYIIKDFKAVPFILGHMGKDQYREAIKLAKKYENVFVETSLQPYWVIREAVNVLGAEKVLMGSDFPALRQSLAVSQVKKALKGSDLYKVSHENAENLIGI